MNQFPEQQIMTPAEWYTVPDNPVQRDTKRHADQAAKKHLTKSISAHWIVHMAKLPDGRCFKLDGHTRSLLWEDGRLEAPEQLMVITHLCQDIEEVKTHYSTHDNRDAGEKAPDIVYGGFRLHGINPQSSLFKKCMLATVMRILPNTGDNQYNNIGKWKSEIIAFDEADPVYGPLYPSGVVAGALATFRRHPEAAAEFWSTFQADGGCKEGTTRDGVQALREYIPINRSSSGRDGSTELYGLACCVISALNNGAKAAITSH